MKTPFIVVLFILLSFCLPINAEETGTNATTDTISVDLEELTKDIDINNPDEVAALALENPGHAVGILEYALNANEQNVESFVSGLLQSEPVLVESLISASVDLPAPVTTSVINTAKITLPAQEQEIVVLALSEGIDPQLVTEPTAAGPGDSAVEVDDLASNDEELSQEVETIADGSQTETVDFSSPPVSGGNSLASPN